MERQKFRNHFSIVFEKMGAFLWILILFAISSMDDLIGELATLKVSFIPVLIGIGIFLLVVGLIMGWQFWIWSKTWITLDESSISVEKNTFTSSKNTLGIKNISNVNVEQNLFEMFMGSSKVKINTNSFSTADSTDIKIVLKKKDAEKLKQELLQQMEILNGNEVNVSSEEHQEVKEYDVKASAKDIILNSIYSLNIIVKIISSVFSVAVVIGLIVSLTENAVGESEADKYLDNILTLGVIIALAVIIPLALLAWSFLQSYFKLYGFSAKRDKDKIYIKYGLFKQLDYSVPVDKINAVIIHQTLIARIFRKYSIEMVNVGMGDDKEENTYLCLYGSKEKIMKSMETLLPEFVEAVSAKVEKQPKATWIITGIHLLIELLIFSILGGVIVLMEAPMYVAIIGVSFIMVVSVIAQVFKYITTGINISDEYIGIRQGTFAVEYTITKIEKVQYLTINTNALTNKLGIVRGHINILAMMLKSIQILPYFKKEKVEDISRVLVKSR